MTTHAWMMLEKMSAPCGAAEPMPRALVVLAHPDDETLALGARLERFRESVLLCVTDGAPADGNDARAHGFGSVDAYRIARRQEQAAALAHAGISLGRAHMLRLAQHGEATIPDQQAMHRLPELVEEVARQIEEFRPEAILTHPYEGGHPDHDSCAFAVHTAVRLLAAQSAHGRRLPVIVEAPFYHAGPAGMVTGCFLPATETVPEIVRELSAEEAARKRERLDFFVSQQEMLANFATERELFRVAPVYDFRQPPHAGRLQYESFGWDLTGAQFRRMAAEALALLQLEEQQV